jgi:hypothetical protein
MDELPKSLAALVAAARRDHDPDEQDARRVASALSAAVPGFQPPPTSGLEASASTTQGTLASASTSASTLGASAGATAASGALAGLGKGLGVLAIVAAVGTGIAVRQATPKRAESSANAAAARSRDATQARTQAPPPADRVEPLAPSLPTPTPAREPEPPARPSETSLHAAQRIEPAEQRAPRRSIVPRPASAVMAATAVPAASTEAVAAPSDELLLIRQATQALRDAQLARAQQLLEQHETRFAQGMLAPERIGLTVITLCRQQRLADARALRDRFLADHPASPLAVRVRSACAALDDAALDPDAR